MLVSVVTGPLSPVRVVHCLKIGELTGWYRGFLIVPISHMRGRDFFVEAEETDMQQRTCGGLLRYYFLTIQP